MTKVLAGITMSVDGYITGPNDGPGKGLGEGGERLHYWVFGGPWAYDSEPKGEPTGEDAAWLAEAVSRVGAVVGGRWTYEAAGHRGGENPGDCRSSSSRTGLRKRRRAERSRSCQVCRKPLSGPRKPPGTRTSTLWAEPTSSARRSRPGSSTS